MLTIPPRWLDPHPDGAFRIALDAVHFWRCRIQENAGSENDLFELLSSDERCRAERYRVDKARRQFVISRGALRQIIGRYLDVLPQTLTFEYLEHGKPQLANQDVRGISFNLAHSENICVIGIAEGRRIGVDVEAIHPDIDYELIAQQIFSPQDRASLHAAKPAARSQAFYKLWTHKEAYIKALGEALSSDAPPPEPAGTTSWTLVDLDVENGYAAALAVDGRVGPVEF